MLLALQLARDLDSRINRLVEDQGSATAVAVEYGDGRRDTRGNASDEARPCAQEALELLVVGGGTFAKTVGNSTAQRGDLRVLFVSRWHSVVVEGKWRQHVVARGGLVPVLDEDLTEGRRDVLLEPGVVLTDRRCRQAECGRHGAGQGTAIEGCAEPGAFVADVEPIAVGKEFRR